MERNRITSAPRKKTLLEVVEGNRREMTVRKAMDPQQHEHDDERRSFLFEPIKRYRSAGRALFVTIT
jgi:hypothetical protein